jgi:uncharacterized protein YcgI (DUF1989 family)
MFTMLEDRVGKHDFLLAPRSPETFEIFYGDHQGYYPSCFENLTEIVLVVVSQCGADDRASDGFRAQAPMIIGNICTPR